MLFATDKYRSVENCTYFTRTYRKNKIINTLLTHRSETHATSMHYFGNNTNKCSTRFGKEKKIRFKNIYKKLLQTKKKKIKNKQKIRERKIKISKLIP